MMLRREKKFLTYTFLRWSLLVLEEAQAGIKIAGRNINNLRYADDTTLMAESEDELKSLLMKVKEESEKVGLKLNIQKMKIMASSPITLWEIDGETVETVSDFIFWGSKITADGDCSHEIKRQVLEVIINPVWKQSIFRDYLKIILHVSMFSLDNIVFCTFLFTNQKYILDVAPHQSEGVSLYFSFCSCMVLQCVAVSGSIRQSTGSNGLLCPPKLVCWSHNPSTLECDSVWR